MLGVTLSLGLSLAPVQKSHAGFLMFVGTVAIPNDIARPIVGVVGGGLLLSAIIIKTNPISGIFAVLPAEASAQQAAITQKLAVEFPFIDNEAVLKNLSQTIKSKYDGKSAEAYVQLTEDEIKLALSGTDVDPDNFVYVVEKLK